MSEDSRSAAARRAAITVQTQTETGVDEVMIERLVRGFYARVRDDDVLGLIFAAKIDDWEPHLGRRNGRCTSDSARRNSSSPIRPSSIRSTPEMSIPKPGAQSLSVPMRHQRIDPAKLQTGRQRSSRVSHRLSETH
jgi:hypothetical protein